MFDVRFNRRLIFFGALLCTSLAGLAWRLVDLQALRHEEFKLKAATNTRSVMTRKPRRGDIRDARGAILATSISVRRVCADPTLILTNQAVVAKAIAPILGLDLAQLGEKLRLQVVRYATNGKPVFRAYVPLKEKVSLDDWERVRQAMRLVDLGPSLATNRHTRMAEGTYRSAVRNSSIFAEEDHLRIYPSGPLAAHVIGFVGSHERETAEGRVSEEAGVDGIERVLDSKLKGIRGFRETELDGKRKEVAMFRKQDVDPQPGWNVVLTLDLGLQHIVESELTNAYVKHAPVSASCVVIRPQTGDILAMANLPGFDPNRPGLAEVSDRRNRVISDQVEPGSTYKSLVIAAALQEGLFGLQDRIDCENGTFVYQKRRLRDGGHSYGVLSVEEVLAKSSNIGAAKIGIALGPERVHRYSSAFGIGAHTGITLPGEIRGLLNALRDWNGFSITSVPMGHEVAVTQMQMAMAIGAIANKGMLMRPRLIERIEDEQGRIMTVTSPHAVRQVISHETAALMVQALKKVVSPIGTGKSIVMEHYSAAGKTGTAQKPKAGPGGSYSDELYVASFIGFFPADDPKLLISVMLDEPKGGHTGAYAAAPVFKAIAERAGNYLNIAPDLHPEAEITTSLEGAGGDRVAALGGSQGRLALSSGTRERR